MSVTHDGGAVPPASPAAPSRFGLLSLALASAIGRETRGLDRLREIEAEPRANGRSQGLEWAIEEGAETLARLRELQALLEQIAPCEAEVRAIGALAARG